MLPPLPRPGGSDDLSPAQRRVMVAGVVVAHLAGVYGLLQVHAVREAVLQAAPMFVDILTPPAPPKPPAPPPPPQQPRPVLMKKPPPDPVIATAPNPAPSSFVAPVPPPEPAPPAPAPPAPVVAATPPAPPAPPPPPPKEIPPSAVQIVVPPSTEYPRISRQRSESGQVIVRFWLDEAGVPQQLQVEKSSGFARLDDAALKGVATARFKPYAENGRAMAGWVRLPIPFNLER